MNRALILAAWIVVSFFAVGQVEAIAADLTGQQQPAEVMAPEDATAGGGVGGQQAQQGQGTSTTPAAALFWQAREKARHEVKERAAVQRAEEMRKATKR